jgi:hypothetical protein
MSGESQEGISNGNCCRDNELVGILLMRFQGVGRAAGSGSGIRDRYRDQDRDRRDRAAETRRATRGGFIE